ncbi:MAG: ATP-binding cassette domain-containing protein, partial [Solobacterium sp.]|nr:ATP-binding cassette domain-containing protein [Solobacterium sp.]
MKMNRSILEMKNIHKRFASTIALNGVDLTANAGEIRGLIGENGSGKSTISSIAAGMQKADEGEMTLNGQPWHPASMIDALEHG